MMMSDIAKDRTAHLLKKRGSVSSLSNHEFRRKEPHGRTKDSVSTVSYMDEPCQPEDASRLTVHMENTYQLGPTKHFPVVIVNHILKDVLTTYLQEEQYEPELCRQMTKTISEGICSRPNKECSSQTWNSLQCSTRFASLVLTSPNASLTSKALPWAAAHPEDFPPLRNPSSEGCELLFPQKSPVHLAAGSGFLSQL
uniref:Dynein light chain Tctex-type family member 5 n=1 Tax=Bos indicus x Bos taurus TaxID=30522 RepID=A0A4W2DGC6_BOBOX